MQKVTGCPAAFTLCAEEQDRPPGPHERVRASAGPPEVTSLPIREYAKCLGERLRKIRQQKGLSLQQVQQRSGGEWKAAVVGAYERGDRNVTVARLSELAEFYGVPVSEILPADADARVMVNGDRRRVVLNLESLERVPARDRDPLSRFTSAIQIRRGDFNGRVLTIREDDLMSLALLYQMTADELSRRLDDWGLIVK